VTTLFSDAGMLTGDAGARSVSPLTVYSLSLTAKAVWA
jgi:hypothetical protein